MTAALEVTDLTAGYGSADVVRDVSLSVDAGEIVAVLGRNGAGKTTTLMSIVGLVPKASGSVKVDGRPITGPGYARTRLDLGIVLEGRSVFPSVTTAQNLQLGRVDPEEAVAIFPELQNKLRMRAGLLSGGEQQMLSLARAICRRPRVLLIDELSFGLAPLTCQRLFAALRTAVVGAEMSVLLVEQHLRFAAEVADRALVMNEGELRLEVPGSELVERGDEIERLYMGGVPGEPTDR